MVQAKQVSGSVSMWVYPLSSEGQAKDEAMWNDFIPDFRSKYPDVKVKVDVLPWANRNQKLTTALAAGAGPDVCYLNDDFIPQHASDGNLEPVQDVLGESASDFDKSALDGLSLDGKLYAVPILREVAAVIGNATAMKKAGVTNLPATWDDILDIGPAFRDAGLYVTSYPGSLEESLNESFYPLLWEAGGEVLNEDKTKAAFNSPEGVDALKFVVKLFEEKFVNRDEGVTLPPPQGGVVLAGKVGALLTAHPSFAEQCRQAWGEDALRVGPPLKRKVQTTYSTIAGLAVFKAAKDKDAAKAWVNYLASPEPMTRILKSGGYMPPRTSLREMYKDDPLLSQFAPYTSLMRSGVKSTSARQIISSLAPHLQSAFLGKSSAEDALKAAEKDVNQILSRNS